MEISRYDTGAWGDRTYGAHLRRIHDDGPPISPPGTNGFAGGVVYVTGKDGQLLTFAPPAADAPGDTRELRLCGMNTWKVQAETWYDPPAWGDRYMWRNNYVYKT
jgi:hypothetical protein